MQNTPHTLIQIIRTKLFTLGYFNVQFEEKEIEYDG
jgi:hypothetical protein